MLASPSLKGWPLSSLRFEAEPGSLSLRLAPCAAQVLQGSGCPVTPPARLHVSQAFHMVNSFQFTREVRLRLTHQSRRGRRRGRRELQSFSAASPFFSAPLRETLSRDCTANRRIRYQQSFSCRAAGPALRRPEDASGYGGTE